MCWNSCSAMTTYYYECQIKCKKMKGKTEMEKIKQSITKQENDKISTMKFLEYIPGYRSFACIACICASLKSVNIFCPQSRWPYGRGTTVSKLVAEPHTIKTSFKLYWSWKWTEIHKDHLLHVSISLTIWANLECELDACVVILCAECA